MSYDQKKLTYTTKSNFLKLSVNDGPIVRYCGTTVKKKEVSDSIGVEDMHDACEENTMEFPRQTHGETFVALDTVLEWLKKQ